MNYPTKPPFKQMTKSGTKYYLSKFQKTQFLYSPEVSEFRDKLKRRLALIENIVIDIEIYLSNIKGVTNPNIIAMQRGIMSHFTEKEIELNLLVYELYSSYLGDSKSLINKIQSCSYGSLLNN